MRHRSAMSYLRIDWRELVIVVKHRRLPPDTAVFYRESMRTLTEAEIPFMVGGAYAFGVFTGISRHTKDLDLFLRPADVERALEQFRVEGFETELTFPHWLAKVYCGDDCLDLIFRAGNGLCEVDDSWFERAREEEVLGERAFLTPPEEMLWMKSYIMERERFDGADVAHLIHSCAERLDWAHLLRRFGEPLARAAQSSGVVRIHLSVGAKSHPVVGDERFAAASAGRAQRVADGDRVCRGTLLSRAQYLPDVHGTRLPRWPADLRFAHDAGGHRELDGGDRSERSAGVTVAATLSRRRAAEDGAGMSPRRLSTARARRHSPQ